MARIISFAWTTPALLAGAKTVTRRVWKPRYGDSFRAGEEITAYDRNPRFHGKPVARIRLTQKPQLQSTAAAPLEDYAAEGFEYLTSIGATVDGLAPFALWARWKSEPRDLYVVRFELLEVLP